jgi:hypothetical protein
MRGARTAGLLAALVALGGAARCTYAPDPESGTLKCSATTPKQCPQGYTCDETTDFCTKNGDLTGAAGVTGSAGSTAGGAGGKGAPCAGSCVIKIDATLTNPSPVSSDKLIGKWAYAAGSTETVTCTDGTSQTYDLTSDDFVEVTRANGTLTGSYFCDWMLTTGPLGNATVILAGQSCTRNATDPTTGTTKFTWHGTTFTFTSTDDKNATLMATIGEDLVDDASKTGCTP